ncbi:MAG: DUF3107 domain-containing protein [Actinomycetes bacterium]
MEVKIGVQNTARELFLESGQSPDELVAAVNAALATPDGVLRLQDERGRMVLVPAASLAYLEIGEQEVRRVGFGAV